MTLKEFILAYGDMYNNDMVLIQDYFIKSGLETEAIDMISKLAYHKAQKDTRSLDIIKRFTNGLTNLGNHPN